MTKSTFVNLKHYYPPSKLAGGNERKRGSFTIILISLMVEQDFPKILVWVRFLDKKKLDFIRIILISLIVEQDTSNIWVWVRFLDKKRYFFFNK